MELHTFILGDFATNAYVLVEAGECWIVDPGFEPDELIDFLREPGPGAHARPLNPRPCRPHRRPG